MQPLQWKSMDNAGRLWRPFVIDDRAVHAWLFRWSRAGETQTDGVHARNVPAVLPVRSSPRTGGFRLTRSTLLCYNQSGCREVPP